MWHLVGTHSSGDMVWSHCSRAVTGHSHLVLPVFSKVGDIHMLPTSRVVTVTLLLYMQDGRYATQVALGIEAQNQLPGDC